MDTVELKRCMLSEITNELNLCKKLMTESATDFAEQIRLLKINQAQIEYIDGKISREEMDSRIEMANQNYQVMLLGQIETMENQMCQYDMNRELQKAIDINKSLERNKKKGFWSKWKKSKQ